MKEALTLFMLAMLIVPMLIGVRRIRRLPRGDESGTAPGGGDGRRHEPEDA